MIDWGQEINPVSAEERGISSASFRCFPITSATAAVNCRISSKSQSNSVTYGQLLRFRFVPHQLNFIASDFNIKAPGVSRQGLPARAQAPVGSRGPTMTAPKWCPIGVGVGLGIGIGG
jgi:hypothetical protein